jgi:hypothetical protein
MAAIDEAYGRGIRPSRDLYRDTRYLHEMLNQMPLGPRRSRTIPQVTYPLASPSLSMAFPFQQILRDELVLKFFDDQQVLDVSMTDFTTTARNPYGAIQNLTNRRFVDATGWTAGAGWAVSGGIATATLATSDLSQASGSQALAFVLSGVYLVTFTMTRTAGSVQPFIGTGAGTSRSASGTYTEEITASANNVAFILTGTGFSGTIDNISVVRRLTITATEGWQLVAFRDRAWFACSATNFLWSIPSNPVDSTGGQNVTVGRSGFNVNTVAKHNGALVIGGPSGTQISTTYPSAAFTYWKKRQRQDQVTVQSEVLDDTYIAWSNDAGGDFNVPFFAFFAMFGIPGDYEAAMMQRIVYADIRAGRMGFYRPRFCGAIRRLKQLGPHLIAYGKNGVSRLTRTPHGYSEEVLLHVGIPASPVVAGDDDEHIFPTTAGEFYHLPANGRPRLLGAPEGAPDMGGFRELLANMTLASIVGSFDPLYRYFWFSDGSKCYLWTGHGMGESDAVQPSSVFRLANSSSALYGTAVVKNDPQTARNVSSIISNGGDTLEVSSMDVVCTEADATSWTATCDWRMSQSAQFKRPTAEDVPDRGRCYVKKTGVELRAVLIAPNYKEVSVDEVGLNVGQGAPQLANIFAGSDTTLSETYP